MNHFIEVSYAQLNKRDEEVCGDQVEIVRLKDGVIAVLSDGLGSGIKANSSAILTAKIAATMLKEGADISEVVDTISKTLPMCKVRKIAYATFTIIYAKDKGDVYIAEFDNPPIFFYSKKRNAILKLEGVTNIINGKKIVETQCQLQEGDSIVAVSDGIIHAGEGETLNYGWEWKHVAKYLESKCSDANAIMTCKDLITICYDLYNGRPSDDTTALTLIMKKIETINLFTGPPLSKEKDTEMVNSFMNKPGKRIICGGTAANIVSRELQRELTVDIKTLTEEIPPISHMKGFDLITEGAVTMDYALEYLKKILQNPISPQLKRELKEENGGTMLVNKLLYECTHINIYLGHSLNLAYKTQSYPSKVGRKFRVVGEMINILKKIGKIINIYYV